MKASALLILPLGGALVAIVAQPGDVGAGVTAISSFSPAYNVSSNGDSARNPDIIRTPGHVFFCAWGQAGGRLGYSTAPDTDAIFFSRASLLSIHCAQPALAITPGGYLVVATASSDSVACARSSDGGFSFLPSPFTVQRLTGSGSPTVAADRVNQVSLLWDVDSSAVWYSKSTNDGQTFSGLDKISANEGTSFLQWRPDVAVDSLRTIYAVWNHSHRPDYTQNWIKLGKSTTLGANWTRSTISDTLRSAHDAQIIARSSGALDVMWVYSGPTDSVYLVRSVNSGATFQRQAAVGILGDGGGTTRNVSMARATDGTLHAVVETMVAGNRECFYFSLPPGSSTFSAPVNVSNSPGASLAPVVILDGTGTPTIVWSEFYGGGRDILLTRKLP